MSDDCVDAARCAHAAAYNLGEYPRMTHEQEIAVWKQAFLEQKARADGLFRAWQTMVVIATVTNLGWVAWVFLK